MTRPRLTSNHVHRAAVLASLVTLVAAAWVFHVRSGIGAAQAPAAPQLTSVTVGDTALTVAWTAPTGTNTSQITAYDLRYIETDASDKSDSEWTVQDSVWTEGNYSYVLAGLTNGTSYDVQMRAVTTNNGTWSSTSMGTPADHGNATSSATALTIGTPLGGNINADSEVDYFQISLTEASTLVVFTSGSTDTMGTLLSSSSEQLDFVDDSDHEDGWPNFLIWQNVESGTYYVKVEGWEDTTGLYVIHAKTFTDTSSNNTAETIGLDESGEGVIDSYNDVDYFKLVLSTNADIIVRSEGAIEDMLGEIRNTSDVVVASNGVGFMLPNQRNFIIRTRLTAGTYYIRVKSHFNSSGLSNDQGPYTLYVDNVTEPGNNSTSAVSADIGDTVGGNISPASDVDYLRVDVDSSTKIVIRAVSKTVDIDGTLLASDQSSIMADIYDEVYSSKDQVFGFTIRHTLAAGTYYVKIESASDDKQGAYTVKVYDQDQFPFNKRYYNTTTYCGIVSGTVTDPLWGCQWYLDNTGKWSGTSGEDINIGDVWDTTKGSGIAVSVVDNGLDVAHEDLRENVDAALSHSYVTTGLLSDRHNHGTQVAGVLAARDNHRGIIGVAPRATIYAYDFLRNSTNVNLADSMTRNRDSVAVSNNSWGMTGKDPALKTVVSSWEIAVDSGVNDGFGGKGIFYVFAGGNGGYANDNSNYEETSNYYAVTSVCATNKTGKRARTVVGGSVTPYSEKGANLWVCAPSYDSDGQPVHITTTTNFDKYTRYFSGTSASAPQVSGVAALMRAANSDLTWRDVKLILAGTARKNDANNTGWDAGALKYGSASARYSFNHEYGFGVVDAEAAVDAVDTWTLLPKFIDETQTSADTDLEIPDTNTTQTSSLTMGSEVSFVEYVELEIHFDAPRVRDLDIQLVSPSGETSQILEHCGPCWKNYTGAYRNWYRFGSAKHLGEDPSGTWQLRVTDRVTGADKAEIKAWRLKIYGHRSTPDDPPVTSTAADSNQITVFWSPPTNAGAGPISSYDVRYIRNDAADKADTNWSEIIGVGTAHTRGYTISGLTNGVQYDVQLRAVNSSGNGQWSSTSTKTPAANVNAAPYFTEGATSVRSIAESSSSGSNVGRAVGAFDTDSDTLTYSLTGATEQFSVDASTGQLTTKSSLSFESESRYTVTVSVTDSKDANGTADTETDATISVTIDVTDVEEAGVVGLTPASIRPGQAVAATLSDPDGGVIDLSWSWHRSSDKSVWTAIGGASSASYTASNSDVGSYLRATASYRDRRGPGKSASAVTAGQVQAQPRQAPTPVFRQPPPVNVPAKPRASDLYSDLSLAGVHQSAVVALIDDGIVEGTGCGGGRLCPDEALPRWEAAVWLVRVLDGEDTPRRGSVRFADVGASRWWAPYVERLAELEVTLGCSLEPARFCPYGVVTRAQMASFLVRAFDLAPGDPAGFEDTADTFSPPDIDALYASGITRGCSADPLLYCPYRDTIRGEMASFLHRARTRQS